MPLRQTKKETTVRAALMVKRTLKNDGRSNEKIHRVPFGFMAADDFGLVLRLRR